MHASIILIRIIANKISKVTAQKISTFRNKINLKFAKSFSILLDGKQNNDFVDLTPETRIVWNLFHQNTNCYLKWNDFVLHKLNAYCSMDADFFYFIYFLISVFSYYVFFFFQSQLHCYGRLEWTSYSQCQSN